MKAISKNLGKLNQYVGERLQKAAKHELTEEFKQLEHATEVRREGSDLVLEACLVYLKSVDKKKDGKHSAIESFGMALVNYGSDLSEESKYGQAMLKLGEVQSEIAVEQAEYANRIREALVAPLDVYVNEMKQVKVIRGKLENRRLDYDAKLNRLQKSKKEDPILEEEMRIAHKKYEESLAAAEDLMLSLNEREDVLLQDLVHFLDAQHDYHDRVAEMLHKLKSTITNTKIKGRRTHQPRTATFDSVSTPLSGRAPSPFVQAAAIAQGDGSDSPKFVGSPLARSPVKTANGPMDSSGTPEVVDPAAILASLKKTGNGTLPRGETPKSLAVPDATQGAVPSRQISSVSETASPATVDSTPLARGAVVAAPAIEHMASFQTVSTSNFTAGQGGSFMSGTTVSSKAAPVPSTPTTSAAATNTTPAASAVLSSATDPVLSTTSTANAVVNDNTTAVAATPISATRQLVRANYSFYGENSEELTLAKGDVVAVIQEISEGWWVGELNGNRGMFPANYCEPVMDASTLADVSEGSQPIIQKSRERMDAIIADDHNEDTLIQSIHESIHSSKVKAIPAMTAMSQAEQVTSQEVSDVPDSILDIYAAGGNGSVSDVALDDGPASAPVEAASTSAPQALPLAVPVQAATSIPSHLVVSPTTAKAQEYTASMVNLERQTDKHMEALQAAMLEFQAELVPMPDAATVEPVPVVVAAPVAVAQPVAKALTAKPTQTPSTTPAQTHKNAPMSPAHANLSVAETLYAPSTSSLGRGKNVAANTAPAAAKTNLAMAETLFIPSSPSRGKNVAVAAAAPLAAGESPSQTPVESHMTAAQKYQMKAMAQAAAMNRRNSLTANTAQVLPGELAVAPAALAQGSPALAKKESLKAVPSLSPGSTPSSPALTQKDVTKAMAAGAASAAAVTAELSSTVAPGTVGACVSCGCNSFVAGAFKREKCSNCFHTH